MLPIAESKKFLAGTRFIDLFAGLGGFRLAVESFGGKCVFSSDIDAAVANVYELNFGERPAGDITKIAAADIPPHDILCAGFPCQPSSVSGKKAGFKAIRGTLFFDIARIVKHHKPKMVLLETVKKCATRKDSRTLKTIVSVLTSCGYTVHYKSLNASHYGVPQSRVRLYIVAFRKDLPGNKFQFPVARLSRKNLRNVLEPNNGKLVGTEVDVEYELDADYAEKIAGLPKRPIRIGKIGLGRRGQRIYHPRGHAITLATSFSGVGRTTGLYLINGRLRSLSPRECARLNGFPDWYKPHRRKTVACKQFGNSVVVDVLQYVLANCKNVLGK